MEPTEKFDAIAERSRIILRVRTFFLHADGRPAFLVPNALVKNLPDQPTQAVCDGTDGLSVSKAWDEAAIHVGEDCARRLLHAAGADTRQDQRRTPAARPAIDAGSVAQKSQANYCTTSCTIPDCGGWRAESLAISSHTRCDESAELQWQMSGFLAEFAQVSDRKTVTPRSRRLRKCLLYVYLTLAVRWPRG